MKLQWLAGASMASLLLVAAPAQAASYLFEVIYSGGGVGVQAPGSDDILSTAMAVGDDFTYTLNGGSTATVRPQPKRVFRRSSMPAISFGKESQVITI